MKNQNGLRLNKFYFLTILLLMLLLPVISIIVDYNGSYRYSTSGLIALTGQWFIFWSIGVRLLTAGIRQVTKPTFTLQQIFHIQNTEGSVIVKELGFANICLGLTAVISLFIPGWRPASAFAGGLYLGIAGINHIVKKPESINEVIAMVSDLLVFLVIGIYLYNIIPLI